MKKQGKYWISLQKFPYRIPLQRSLTEREKTRAVSMLLSVSYKSFLQAYYLQKKKKKKIPVVSKENAKIKIDSFQGKARCH